MLPSSDDSAGLESLWDQILSRQAGQVLQAYEALQPDEQRFVLAHLKRMATEPGWHPEQRLSARAALDVIAPTTGS